MQLDIQPVFQKELTAYGRDMGVWVKSFMRYIQFAVNSFADVYRASVQEMTRSPVRDDIASLSL